jgi:hypothetical protein
MPIALALHEFQASAGQANAIIAAAYRVDSTNNFFFTATEQAVLVESAFLRLFVAWEAFLESTFVNYMIGAQSLQNNVLPRYVSPRDLDHAHSMVVGGMRYADWSTPEVVRKLAKLFFDGGEPYETVLAQIHTDLLDIKTVRNAAAHLSSTTSTQLDSVASRVLSTPVAGMTVARFVLHRDPRSATGESMMQTYNATLKAAAHLIANA